MDFSGFYRKQMEKLVDGKIDFVGVEYVNEKPTLTFTVKKGKKIYKCFVQTDATTEDPGFLKITPQDKD